jgi:hypothetical protein
MVKKNGKGCLIVFFVAEVLLLGLRGPSERTAEAGRTKP